MTPSKEHINRAAILEIADFEGDRVNDEQVGAYLVTELDIAESKANGFNDDHWGKAQSRADAACLRRLMDVFEHYASGEQLRVDPALSCWMAIDSAPKDGTRILLGIMEDGEIINIADDFWYQDRIQGGFDEYTEAFDSQPTHWTHIYRPFVSTDSAAWRIAEKLAGALETLHSEVKEYHYANEKRLPIQEIRLRVISAQQKAAIALASLPEEYRNVKGQDDE